MALSSVQLLLKMWRREPVDVCLLHVLWLHRRLRLTMLYLGLRPRLHHGIWLNLMWHRFCRSWLLNIGRVWHSALLLLPHLLLRAPSFLKPDQVALVYRPYLLGRCRRLLLRRIPEHRPYLWPKIVLSYVAVTTEIVEDYVEKLW